MEVKSALALPDGLEPMAFEKMDEMLSWPQLQVRQLEEEVRKRLLCSSSSQIQR